MSSSGPGARTGGDREHSRYGPGSKAHLPHMYGVLYALLVYRFVPLAMGCESGGPHVNKQGSALVHMYLIRLVAKDKILRQCEPYNIPSTRRDQ